MFLKILLLILFWIFFCFESKPQKEEVCEISWKENVRIKYAKNDGMKKPFFATHISVFWDRSSTHFSGIRVMFILKVNNVPCCDVYETLLCPIKYK